MKFEITSNLPIPPATTRGVSKQWETKDKLLNQAVNDRTRKGYSAAKQIHAAYYGDLAKVDGEEYQSQIRYLAKEINKRRRENLPID